MVKIQCAECGKYVVPRFSLQRSKLPFILHSTQYHICPDCGAMMYKLGGGPRLSLKLLPCAWAIGAAIYTPSPLQPVVIALAVFVLLPAFGSYVPQNVLSRLISGRLRFGGIGNAEAEVSLSSYRVAKDIELNRFFVEVREDGPNWRPLLESMQDFGANEDSSSKVKFFDSHDEADQFISARREKEKEDPANLVSKRNRGNIVRSGKIHGGS